MASAASQHKENVATNRGAAQALSAGELKMMLGQCLKMASENKITGQNTWGLPLIEHLDDLIKEDAPGQNTNFQRASVTLDAGVKIYSYRVDSVHTETFKILGGLGRASGPAGEGDGDPGEGGVAESPSKRKRRGDLNPEATLEPSLEALNVKKFDLAFAVDPLFHKTSAQFDEGGARGLLLNNLSVYRGCEIVFDSMDVPETAVDSVAGAAQAAAAAAARVSLDAVAPELEALAALTGAERVSPTLDDILALMGSGPAAGAAAAADEFVRQVATAAGNARPWVPPAAAVPAVSGGQEGAPAAGEGEGAVPADDVAPYGGDNEGAGDDYGGFDGGYDDFSDHEDCGAAGRQASSARPSLSGAADSAALGEDAISWLIAAGAGSASTSYVTGAKGWAGASHWRYRAVPQGNDGGEEVDQPAGGAGGRGRKKAGGARRKNEPLDFVALMAAGASEPQFELLPSGGRAPARRAKPAAKSLLPEDHHYKAEVLARYALRPRSLVAMPGTGAAVGGKERSHAEAGAGGFADFGDDGFGFDGGDGEEEDGVDAFGSGPGWGLASGDVGDALDLVEAARKVDKVEVNYSRAAKQVDVRSLKELMWSGIHSVLQRRGGGAAAAAAPIEFADVLASVPEANAAGRLEDLSVHLCFICVLHLANEHGLVVRAVPELDRLLISNVPDAP